MCSKFEDHWDARRADSLPVLDDGKPCQAIAEFLHLEDEHHSGPAKDVP